MMCCIGHAPASAATGAGRVAPQEAAKPPAAGRARAAAGASAAGCSEPATSACAAGVAGSTACRSAAACAGGAAGGRAALASATSSGAARVARIATGQAAGRRGVAALRAPGSLRRSGRGSARQWAARDPEGQHKDARAHLPTSRLSFDVERSDSGTESPPSVVTHCSMTIHQSTIPPISRALPYAVFSAASPCGMPST